MCIRRTEAENHPDRGERCTPVLPLPGPRNGRRRTFVRRRKAATTSVPRPPRPAYRTRGQTRISWKPIWASADELPPSFGCSSASVFRQEIHTSAEMKCGPSGIDLLVVTRLLAPQGGRTAEPCPLSPTERPIGRNSAPCSDSDDAHCRRDGGRRKAPRFPLSGF